MDKIETEKLVKGQIEFYRKLAPEYDNQVDADGNWSLLADKVMEFFPRSQRCLELASGTGLWTKLLLKFTESITVVDASIEMHTISMNRLKNQRVSYVLSDIFQFTPRKEYDLIFAGFWMSHIPKDYFENFWKMVDNALLPNGKVLMVDSFVSGPGGGGTKRRLSNGKEFNIVKIQYDILELENILTHLGWNARLKSLSKNIYLLEAQKS